MNYSGPPFPIAELELGGKSHGPRATGLAGQRGRRWRKGQKGASQLLREKEALGAWRFTVLRERKAQFHNSIMAHSHNSTIAQSVFIVGLWDCAIMRLCDCLLGHET